MNIQQFQYIIAVSEEENFDKAAAKCFITQSTLSTMISKFENEIGIKIFDRKTKPVSVTKEGAVIIAQLKIIDYQIRALDETIHELKGEIKGALKIGIIPTVAPFILPLFLQNFAVQHPNLQIEVLELTTSEIVKQLKSRDLDVGIVSTPLLDKDLQEIHLYNEAFLWFDESENEIQKKKDLTALDLENFWLLEEGHCMRTQVLRICDLDTCDYNATLNIKFKAGSIDSLLRFVKSNHGKTLLPYLATLNFTEEEKKKLTSFKAPIPTRSIGLIVHKHFVKKNLLKLLQEAIINKVQPLLPKNNAEEQILAP